MIDIPESQPYRYWYEIPLRNLIIFSSAYVDQILLPQNIRIRFIQMFRKLNDCNIV